MQLFQEAGQIGKSTVKKLRSRKLENGLPFMINSKELAKGQAYMEYPDGTISLVIIAEGNRELILLRYLAPQEAALLREKYNLL